MQIRVATLNFSGINISPFEYYDGTNEKSFQSQYSECLFHSAQMAKIDKNFQKSRYSILYRSDVGVARGKLLNREQFEAVWDLTYDDNYPTDENSSNFQKISNLNAIDKLKLFDRIMYESFLETVFGKIEWNKFKDYDPQLYLKALKNWHSKAYLQLDLKLECLFEYIVTKNLDVIFIQQADNNAILKSLPDNYFSVHFQSSMIIAKKSLFQYQNKDKQFQQKFSQLLNFNQDSCHLKVKDYLLISSHLSSKKIKIQQANKMKQTLDKIIQQYPNIKIVMGIDANHFLQSKVFNIYPLTNNQITTRKRRTDMQLQFEKSGIIVQDVKDHILTNMKINQTSVQTIQGKHIGNELLPNQSHPFDHFIVYSSIIDESVNSIKQYPSECLLDLSSPVALKKTQTRSTATTNFNYSGQKNFCQDKIIPNLFNFQNKSPSSTQKRISSIQISKNYKRVLFQPGVFQFKDNIHSKSNRKIVTNQQPLQTTKRNSQITGIQKQRTKFFTTKNTMKPNINVQNF